MTTKLRKVKSLRELWNLAQTDVKYLQLLFISSSNLGGSEPNPNATTTQNMKRAYQNLIDNATAGEECSEEGVVDEVNFCIDLVK